jgi:hypothetical protein
MFPSERLYFEWPPIDKPRGGGGWCVVLVLPVLTGSHLAGKVKRTSFLLHLKLCLSRWSAATSSPPGPRELGRIWRELIANMNEMKQVAIKRKRASGKHSRKGCGTCK